MADSGKLPALSDRAKAQLRELIKLEIDNLSINNEDDGLLNYILVLVSNRKTEQNIIDDLDLFFPPTSSQSSAVFTKWLVERVMQLAKADKAEEAAAEEARRRLSGSGLPSAVVVPPKEDRHERTSRGKLDINPRTFGNAFKEATESRRETSSNRSRRDSDGDRDSFQRHRSDRDRSSSDRTSENEKNSRSSSRQSPKSLGRSANEAPPVQVNHEEKEVTEYHKSRSEASRATSNIGGAGILLKAVKESHEATAPRKFTAPVEEVPSAKRAREEDEEIQQAQHKSARSVNKEPEEEPESNTAESNPAPRASVFSRLQINRAPSDSNLTESADQALLSIEQQEEQLRQKKQELLNAQLESAHFARHQFLQEQLQKQEQLQLVQQQSLEKAPPVQCKFFPKCSNMKDCKFTHPQVICKFSPTCTNALCNYFHPPKPKPAPAVVNPTAPCKFHPNCKNKECPFFHPRMCKKVYKSVCGNPVCVFHHAPELAPPRALEAISCRFGANCLNEKCSYSHPALTAPTCRYGLNCLKEHCSYSHPQGKAPHISERQFAAAESTQAEFTPGQLQGVPQ